METNIRGAGSHNYMGAKGSRFAVFDTNKEDTEDVVVDTDVIEPKEKVTLTTLGSPVLEGVARERTSEKRHEKGINNTIQQHKSNNNGRQEANAKMFKSKSIMERFVKSRSGGENKPVDSLKASGGEGFKHQKATKTRTQWEKAKSLILSDEVLWTNNQNPRNLQGGVGDYILNNRPSDLNTSMGKKGPNGATEDGLDKSPGEGKASNLES